MIKFVRLKYIIALGTILFSLFFFYSQQKCSYRKHCISKQEINKLNENNVLKHIELKSLNLSPSIFLEELINSKNKSTLIFRIPRFSCGSCVNREIGTIDKHIKGNVSGNVITIADFDQHRFFSAYSKSITSKRFKIFNYNKVLTNLDKNKKPYLILVNNNCKILDVFIVDKQNANATKLFLDSL